VIVDVMCSPYALDDVYLPTLTVLLMYTCWVVLIAHILWCLEHVDLRRLSECSDDAQQRQVLAGHGGVMTSRKVSE
jgi:hypothetical protein